MKYILVTGGVISGIGKGIVASSIGTILKGHGLKVTSIKIDPYINIDAGTFSPNEHGEVFVLDDGGEVDLDLGNYERFLDVTLHQHNNITTGKIYSKVIEKERRGHYLGKTVQVVPHITDEIQDWVQNVAQVPVDEDGSTPEVCIIELGGTIGDIEGMPFVEAFRQFQYRVKKENFCVVHVSLVPTTSCDQQKTKPTQASVRELRGFGLSPDFIVCRSTNPITEVVKQKIFNCCHVMPECVICLHDVANIHRVPLELEDQNTSNLLSDKLNLNLSQVRARSFLKRWRVLVRKEEHLHQLHESVTIALVGKYTKSEDAYASVIKALQHAAVLCNRKLDLKCIEAEDLEENTRVHAPEKYFKSWDKLCTVKGILVPGGFDKRGFEGKVSACKYAREKNIPFLGVCLGLQAAVVEFSRNVLNWTDANSQEVSKNGTKDVVIEMPEHNTEQKGGTMRLGKRRTNFMNGPSKIKQLYKNVSYVEERHRHRYEVNPEIVPDLQNAGMQFVGQDETGQRMEIMELNEHVYYVACQYHPEYLSRPLKPSPPYLGLILAASSKLEKYLSKNLQGATVVNNTLDSSDDEFDGISPTPSEVELHNSSKNV